jgi:hypothetical protein
MALAAGGALALSMIGAASPALASGGSGTETVAAIDPALTAGRGATVGFVEQEAENAATNGTILGFDTTAYTLAAEASGRKAVRLTSAGQFVEFTLTRSANAITVRYSIPDAPNGGGIDAPLTVSANGRKAQTLTLTSKYSWLYNQYPFSNDPNAGLLHSDWWVTECACVPAATTPQPTFPTPFRSNHFYDEQRVLLGHNYQAGDRIRLTVPPGSSAAWTVIDLVDFEQVAPAAGAPKGSISVLAFGADRTGKRESSDAFDAAIAAARAAGKTVFIPAGTFQVNRHIIVDDVTIQGAGNWWTIIKGREVALDAPLPDGSVHTGVGFYGRYAEDGGSSNVHLSDFAIEGDVRERVDTDQVNGVGGALSDSTIDGLYIHHTKVGLWFDGPMDDLTVRNTIVADVLGDGVNFRRGVTNSRVENSFFRNTGDDALAMWSHHVSTVAVDENAHNVFDRNTIQTPVLANGIAIYGGRDNTVSNNVVADPVREGSGLHAGQRFNSTPFAGTLRFTNNTTVRAGTYELNWNIGLGAIWLFALEGSLSADIEVTGDHYLQSTYNAIMLVADWSVKDLYSIENVSFKDVRVDGTGTSVLSARAMGSASFENVDARNVGAPVPWPGDDRELFVNNCGAFNWDWANGSEFSMVDLGSNDYFGDPTQTTWLPAWLMPNLITCNDRPPVVAPPPPAAW